MILTHQNVNHFTHWLRNEKSKPKFQIWNIRLLMPWTRRIYKRNGIAIDRIKAITLKDRVYCQSFEKMNQLDKLCVVVHEYRHILQGRDVGWDMFYNLYLSSTSMRIFWEIEANADAICAAHMVGVTLDYVAMAKGLMINYMATPAQVKEARMAFEYQIKWLNEGKLNPVKELWNECYSDNLWNQIIPMSK